MLLLDVMMYHLGPLYSWPTYVLQHLFIDHPSPVRSSKLKKVMAFFRKRCSPRTGLQVLQACNGAASRFVVEQTSEWYCEWQGFQYKRHLAEYFNMFFKKFI